jgi:glycyl-tRNA synthetase
LSEAYDEQQVKSLSDERRQAVSEALLAFSKSVARNDKLPAGQRDALIERATMIEVDVAANLPQIPALLDMQGASSIELGKKLRGQAEPALDEAYRTVLHLKPIIAPVKVAVFPLKRNHLEIVAAARQIRKDLQSDGNMRTVYDDTGAIGKLYRRQDEIGTPFCITVDFDTLGEGKDAALKGTVTVRDRDTMAQERVPMVELKMYLAERMR